jgi:ribosomal-protein-alanine N-acetyltransferase
MEPILITGNIILRPITERDIAPLFTLFSNEAVMRFMDIERFSNVTEAAQMITFFREKFTSGEGMRWAITLEDRNELIGTCGFHDISSTHHKLELGYDLLPSYWGRGIMTHSIHRLLQYGFDELQINRIEAIVDPVNTSSYRLLEKLGFVQEGLLRQAYYQKGAFVDAYVYSILQRDYRYDMQF